MLQIPKSFTLCGTTIIVEKVEYIEDGNIYGRFCDFTSTITIAEKIWHEGGFVQVPEHIQIKTFYHELFHAFNYNLNTEASEEIAQTFSNFMYEFAISKVNS